MPYSLKTYDGTSLVTIADGSVDDQASTSLFLIGKNVTGYGTRQNENFLYLLENFAGINPPDHRLVGQTWFDKTSGSSRLKVFDGISWKGLAVTEVSDTEPTTLKLGDFWFDSTNKQVWVQSTDNGLTLIGPEVTAGFGVTKLVSKSIADINATNHAVINVSIDDDIIGIYSKDSFTIAGNEAEYTTGFRSLVRGLTLKEGVTISGLDTASKTATETIDAQWSFSSGIKIGDSTSITFDNNGNLVLNAGVKSIILNGASILPYNSNTPIGTPTQPFNAVYSNALTSGSALKELEILGDVVVATGSKIRPYLDNNVSLGTSAAKWKNFYTYQVSTGNINNIGSLEGDWRVGTGSRLTTPYLSTVLLTAGSTGADGTIVGNWKLGSGSRLQATALIDANGDEFNPDENAIRNTIVKRTGTAEVKASKFIGPVEGDLTGDIYSSNNVRVLDNGGTTATFTGNVLGNVTGNLIGNTTGTHTGPVVGDIVGDVTGNIRGNLSGNVSGNTTGTHTGPVIGNITGNVIGNTTGTHTGPVIGSVLGNVTGNVIGNTSGTHTGPVTGSVSGNVNAVRVIAELLNASTLTSELITTPLIRLGSSTSRGIEFSSNPGDGTGDTASIRYYAVSGEKTVLEIAVANDASGAIQDSLYLNAAGGVGVKTLTPRYALDVNGDIGCTNLHGVADNAVLWNGSNRYISTSAPTNDLGVDGDFWFQREA